MKNFLRLVGALTVGAVSALAQVRNVGPIVVDYNSKSLAVRVSANVPELNTLALAAFNLHGRYRLVASDFAYDIKFSQVSATQVRVDITKGAAGAPVASETVTGKSLRLALLRAADVAVEKTNGLGLRGFFTARLAFIGERTGKKEVYVSDLFLSDAKQITRDNASVLTPRWSPDGARLLYTSFYKSGFPDIFQQDLATNARSTFVSFRGLNSGARFSPNGQQVAMILTGEGTPEIYISNAQGRQVARKTRSEAVKASPCWSPDGARLVFTMEPGPQLYTMSAGGGSVTRLVTGYTYVAEPDWSRTSPNKIACTVRVGGGRFQIAVYDFSLGKATVVSEAPFDGLVPSWLADGRHLVYTARDKNTSALHVLDTETGKSTRISPVNFVAMEANVWTP
ncbi:MAG: biopolymer transporter Tol [Opitutus sp.]|nr:biopolymer transporter Tol [Opitutus sp.]